MQKFCFINGKIKINKIKINLLKLNFIILFNKLIFILFNKLIKIKYKTDVRVYMVWCHTRKLLFIHVPKTGGSTIEHRLKLYKKVKCGWGFKDGKAMQHYTYKDYIKILGIDKYKKYFKFTVSRNPYSRLVSEYNWCVIPGIGKKGGQTMDEFIETCKEIVDNKLFDDGIYHDHFIPQHMFMFDDNNKKRVNKIFRMENYGEIDDFLEKRYNIKNKSEHGRQDYDKIELTKEQKMKVYKIYAKDFELLNYKKQF